MESHQFEPPTFAVCFQCSHHFERAEARWCDCISRSRTGICPKCGKCSCQAPADWITKHGAFTLTEPEGKPEGEGKPAGERIGRDRRPLVLVADDDRVVRTMICRALAGAYRIITAEDGVEALMQAYAHDPALIVTDALMPGLDGRAVSRQIKADPRTRATKVVLITSIYRDRQHESEALREFHVDAFVRKPIEAGELLRIVRGLLAEPMRVAS